MRDGLKVGISGCGIGGMAAALFLHRQGHQVSLFDQFKTPTPIGSGLVIQPVGQAVLDDLGVGQALIKSGGPIFKMSGIESRSRRGVLNVDYGKPGGEVFGLGIHRGTLFDGLYQAVIGAGINIEHGQVVEASRLKGEARFLDIAGGQSFGPFDLLIDASGAGSKLSPIKSRALPYGALWGTVDWPEDIPLPKNRLSQCYRKAHNMLGVMPMGRMPNETRDKAAIFWSEAVDDLPDWPRDGLQAWKDKAVGLWPEFKPFVSQITDAAQMTPATYRHGTLRKPYAQRMAFIGDAAHQASPQLGQGANMALLDAQVLAKALASHDDLQKALKAYAAKRRWHVQLYQTFSAVFTPFYQSDSAALPVLRDYVMNPFSYMWPVKPMLTRLVCGTLIKP